MLCYGHPRTTLRLLSLQVPTEKAPKHIASAFFRCFELSQKQKRAKMNFRAFKRPVVLPYHEQVFNFRTLRARQFSSFIRKLKASARASTNNGQNSNSSSNPYLVPGATAATILMLGALHARRMYDDKKTEEARAMGVEFEFKPDVKASFLKILPLRAMSRVWGSMTDVNLPVWLRPYAYKGWARAFKTDLEEVDLPLEEYASLREFFVHRLREGSRPIDNDPRSLVSPVDGIVMRYGELKEAGAMIEQVKGFSYTASALLGASSVLPMVAGKNTQEEDHGKGNDFDDKNKKSWWRLSWASPKVLDTISSRPMKGLFYCVLYLRPGDYHRVHSPADWNVLVRRHFSGRLLPVNERAARTIGNLYVQNERVVLEGQWQQGFMALAAVGATNIGSVELSIEPELRTNLPKRMLGHSEPPDERIYEPEGVRLRKGDEFAAFNMGSTVVLVFQAPVSNSVKDGVTSNFRFCVKPGDKISVGKVLGRLQ